MNNDIPADIRGKRRFPSDGLSGRAWSGETVASARSIPVWAQRVGMRQRAQVSK